VTQGAPSVYARRGLTGFDEDDRTEVIDAFAPGAFFAEKYRIEALLGGGASAQVYAVTDVRTGTRVALKVLRKERQQTRAQLEEQRARFAREGDVLRALIHPSIVRIFDVGAAADGTPYIAMEALEGETLAHRLLREKTLPLDVTLRLVAFAADAIDHAHALGVVHRDIKPENLFLPSDGSVPVKVLDFGLSRVVETGARLTATGATIGTPRYMAPEQILSARDSGPAVDVYALGVCAYEALAGTSPFDAADQAQLLGAILHGRRVPLRARRPEFSAAVEVVLEKAMATRASARHMSAVELAGALCRAAQLTPRADVPTAVVRAALDAPPIAPVPPPAPRDPASPDPVAVARAQLAARAESGQQRVAHLSAYEQPPRFSSVPEMPAERLAPMPSNPWRYALLAAAAIALVGVGVLAAWLMLR